MDQLERAVRDRLRVALTRRGTEYIVTALRVTSAGRREVLVWDEGPGIDDAVRQRLFQPFSAGQGGVGLGLSICRQIAEAMGAQVTLFNRMDAGQVIGVDAVVAWDE